MALREPILFITLLIIGAITVALVFKRVRGREEKHSGGLRVANTSFAKSLPAFAEREKIRKRVYTACTVLLVLALVFSALLAARPSDILVSSDNAKRKDIMLCLDISTSICDVNYEIVDNLKDIVGKLEGERFGITIFNTSSVVYVPLTDDYEYVQDALEDLKKLFRIEQMDADPTRMYSLTDEDADFYYSFMTGTLVNNEKKGSSLIGEGLASAMYAFPGLGEEGDDRTRMIIMSTDNAESPGTEPPLIRFPEAMEKCAENNVKVFGIFPSKAQYNDISDVPYDTAKNEFESSLEKNGGKFYQLGTWTSTADIVKEINKSEVKSTTGVTRISYEDQPYIPFILIFLSFSGLLIVRAVSRR